MYSKQTWNTGDVITEEKLNHIEEGISAGGGIYSFEEEVSFFDGEVTTVSAGAPSGEGEITLQGNLPKSDISVTFNGQDYTLPYGSLKGGPNYWGEVGDNGPSFTNFPVFVGEDGSIYTSEAGTYALKIVGNSFELNDVIKNSFPKNILVNVSEHSNTYSLDKTYSEINSAVLNGDNVKFLSRSEPIKEYYLDSISSSNGWLLKLFYVTYDSTAELNTLQFNYTNSAGYPSTSGSSPIN